ncbi:MAG: bifunctional riboflavin kinase/FAD synthetase [Deltaproteobacteria bacterium]|nr:bifunctional riboflavin kinase/FAD synthetase [Deltaproteobacteria bacterium]
MELIKNIDKIRSPYKNAVITTGNFDGVHKGHQKLLDRVKAKAVAINGTAIAITFEPHSLKVLKKDTTLNHITPFEQKKELLSDTNLDVLICIPFTKEFASISAKDFVENILVRQIGMKVIVVGKDYTFGKGREGDIDFLRKYGEKAGFEVIVEDWKQMDGQSKRISSTRIRRLITDGKVEEAKEMLGRHYQVRGTVLRGRDRGGKLLGFPTANINLLDELRPKNGVYAVTVITEGTLYNGVANIGFSPTFGDHEFTVEVHILDFNSNIYNKKIKVNFISRLRDEKKFSGIQELSDQIKADIINAVKILNTKPKCFLGDP